VAAVLVKRWEAALRDLKDAEERLRHEQEQPRAPEALSPEEREAFLRAGKTNPELWRQDLLSPEQKKAFLRSLIDKVVVHRTAPATLQVRIVWRGGDTTTTSLPVTVGSLTRLSSAEAMEKEILQHTDQGKTDEEIAVSLTREGYRSPKHATVLPSTVRAIRLRHRLFRKRSQSHPRNIPGSLTVSQIARSLEIPSHWVYDRIHNGTIQVALDSKRRLYLFPDQPKTITLFKQLRAGELQKLRF
jgi:DNA-binding CsgD family transcriptional regulator